MNSKFEVGKQYYDHSSCDYETIYVITITKRTEKSVWFTEGNRPERRAKIFWNGANEEYIIPERYSMCPVFNSSAVFEPEPKPYVREFKGDEAIMGIFDGGLEELAPEGRIIVETERVANALLLAQDTFGAGKVVDMDIDYDRIGGHIWIKFETGLVVTAVVDEWKIRTVIFDNKEGATVSEPVTYFGEGAEA